MPLRLNLSKLTGNPGVNGWCQVHDFKPDDPEKLRLRGHFFAVISTKASNDSFESVVIGREIISRLHEEYFGNLNDPVLNVLTNSLKKVYVEFRESIEDLEIITVAILGDIIYSASVGGSTLSIFRSGMLGKLLIGPKDIPTAVSGKAQENDILLAGTKSFFQTFPEGIIKANLELKDMEAVSESFAPTLHSLDMGNIGALFLRFGSEKVSQESGITGLDLIDSQREEERVNSIGQIKENTQTEGVDRNYMEQKTVGYALSDQSIDSASMFKPKEKSKISFPKLTVTNPFSKILDKLPKRSLKVVGEGEDVEIQRRKKVSATVGLILIALLVVSIVFGMRQRNSNVQKSKYQDRLSEAQHDMDEAISLFSVSPERSRELFSQSRDIVSGLLGQGVKDQGLNNLRQQLTDNEGSILGEYRQDANLFIDLSLLTNNFSGNRIVASNDIAYVLDSNLKRVVSVEIDNKRTEVVAGPGVIEEASEISAYTDKVYVLNSKGVFEVDNSLKKVLDKDWSDNSLIYSYSSNMYLLDKGNSTISRFSGTNNGFGGKSNWLTTGTFDFSGVISWSIDNSIWLLDNAGKISKFTSGNQQSFEITGLNMALSSPKGIYTNEDEQNLYILDSGNSRVVVLNKDGSYKAQYISDKVKDSNGLVVSEKQGKIILLNSGKLYSLDLKS